MYRDFPTPTPRLLDCKPGIVQPTLVKKFIRAVAPAAPRQHGDRIDGESKVILASLQGILRDQLVPKQIDFLGGVCRFFQLGSHGAASTAFNHTTQHDIPDKVPFHKGGIPLFDTMAAEMLFILGGHWSRPKTSELQFKVAKGLLLTKSVKQQ